MGFTGPAPGQEGFMAWMRDPLYGALFQALLLAAVILVYWWLAIQWAAGFFLDPGLRFTFITTTFLLALGVCDSVFIVRYYQMKHRDEFRLQAERLRESETNYRMIIENMQDVFFRTGSDGRLVMVSPAALPLTGYGSVEDLIGRDAGELYASPNDRTTLMETLARNGKVTGYPLTIRRRDGTLRSVAASCHYYRDTAGAVAGTEGIIHDITDLKQAEEALRIANRKLSLLSSITRHDIKNQLMALRAFLELSGDSLDRPEELAKYVAREKEISETIDRQISFTRDYEDLGMKEPVWQEITGLVDEAARDLSLKSVNLSVTCQGREVFADPLLSRVFYNLLDNALRYGGTRLSEISVSCGTGPGGSLVVTFSDNGAGIDPADRRNLFSKGFGKNTGLGLFLSREILSITDIAIAETSGPGEGARFELTIPKGMHRSSG